MPLNRTEKMVTINLPPPLSLPGVELKASLP